MPTPVVLNVHNQSPIDRWIPFAGKKYTVPQYGTLPFPEEIARAMVGKNRPHCVLQSTEPYDKDWTGPVVWVANITGSDLLPEEVHIQAREDGKLVTRKVPNPHRSPVLVIRSIDGGQVEASDDQGFYWKNLPSRDAGIWPYARRAFPEHVAGEILGRDSMMRFSGQIVRCEPPCEAEPDMSWSYEEVRDYLALVDESAVAGVPKSEDGFKEEDNPELSALMAKHAMVVKTFHRIVAGWSHIETMREFFEMREKPKPKKKKKADALVPLDVPPPPVPPPV